MQCLACRAHSMHTSLRNRFPKMPPFLVFDLLIWELCIYSCAHLMESADASPTARGKQRVSI